MTEQVQNNKEWFEKLKNWQKELVHSLIGQGIRAAIAAKSPLSVWVDKDGGLMVSAGDKRKRGYARFGDTISNSEISDLMEIVEWLLNGAPEEESEEDDD